MTQSKKSTVNFRDKDEVRNYLREASKIYDQDNEFDAILKALMDVVEGQRDDSCSTDIVDSSKFHQGRDRPVTKEQVRILKVMGLLGEEEVWH